MSGKRAPRVSRQIEIVVVPAFDEAAWRELGQALREHDPEVFARIVGTCSRHVALFDEDYDAGVWTQAIERGRRGAA